MITVTAERISAARAIIERDALALRDVSERARLGTLEDRHEAWMTDWEARQAGPERLVEGMWGPAVVCQVLGVSQHTLKNLRREGLPMPDHGRYNLPTVVRWYARREELKGRRSGGRAEQEARKITAQARKLELEGDILAGRHVLRDEVLRTMERAVVEARGSLENLPALVAALVPGDARVEVQDRAREIVESALKSLAEGGRMPAPAVMEATGGSDEEEPDGEANVSGS